MRHTKNLYLRFEKIIKIFKRFRDKKNAKFWWARTSIFFLDTGKEDFFYIFRTLRFLKYQGLCKHYFYITLLTLATGAQFHQRSMYSFYAGRSRKRKKIQLSHKYLFTLLGSTVLRTLMKLTTGWRNRWIILSVKSGWTEMDQETKYKSCP